MSDAGSDCRHLVGLLLGTENDWPSAFEALIHRLGAVPGPSGHHAFDVERVTIEPFSLRQKPRHDLVIDRLAYWYYHPREWLKKVALMDDVYLLNSPFTFQSMEKHAAYCAMIRLGLKIPETVLVPYKIPLDDEKYAYTAARYNQPFDLDAIAEELGYPLFMKPFDGGGWRGVSTVRNHDELQQAYDESGEMLMHLQAAVSDYDVFARSLSIGPETMVMHFDARPADARPVRGRPRLPLPEGRGRGGDDRPHRQRVLPLGVQLLRDARPRRRRLPDRLRQRLPGRGDHLPALLLPVGDEGAGEVDASSAPSPAGVPASSRTRSVVRDRGPGRPDYDEKLAEYRRLADDYFDADRYAEFCATRMAGFDEVVVEYVESGDFDQLIVDTVRTTFPAHEHDHFIAHYRGLLGAWAHDERNRLG